MLNSVRVLWAGNLATQRGLLSLFFVFFVTLEFAMDLQSLAAASSLDCSQVVEALAGWTPAPKAMLEGLLREDRGGLPSLDDGRDELKALLGVCVAWAQSELAAAGHALTHAGWASVGVKLAAPLGVGSALWVNVYCSSSVHPGGGSCPPSVAGGWV